MNSEKIRAKSIKTASLLFGNSIWSVTDLLENAAAIERYISGDTSSAAKPNPASIGGSMINHPTKGKVELNHYPFQSMLLKSLNNSPKCIINSARQMGITTIMAEYVMKKTLKANTNVLVVGPNYTFCNSFISLMSNNLGENKLLQRSKATIEFNNKSKVRCTMPDSFSNSITEVNYVGQMFDIVIVADFAFVSHSIDRELWNALQPLVAPDGQIIIHSTPSEKNGQFYDLWNSGDFSKIFLPYNVHPERDAEWAKQRRELVGEERFKREYECIFRSTF